MRKRAAEKEVLETVVIDRLMYARSRDQQKLSRQYSSSNEGGSVIIAEAQSRRCCAVNKIHNLPFHTVPFSDHRRPIALQGTKEDAAASRSRSEHENCGDCCGNRSC